MQTSTVLPTTADLVIVGGGIVGAATAFFATRAGLHVAVLERRPALSTLTTPASTGAFRMQFDNPEEIALVRETVDIFDNFSELTGLKNYNLDIHKQGYLFCTTDPATTDRQKTLLGKQHSWGLTDVEWLTGDEARARFPYVAPEVVGARFRAGDGWLDVSMLALGYALAAYETGRVTFTVNSEVTAFDLQGGAIKAVKTKNGAIDTAAAVIAAGPFSSVVGSYAGIDIPLSLVRRQKLVMPDVAEVPQNAPMTIDEDTGSHWRPAMRGALALRTAPGVPPGPPLDDVPTSAQFAFDLLDPESPYSVARISPFWRDVWSRGTDHWFLQAGQYAYSPDHRPLLGPTSVPGLYVNCGYSGHGIMTSGAASRLVVDTITGKIAPGGNPFRFDRPILYRELDVL